jgi:hypothetical protein
MGENIGRDKCKEEGKMHGTNITFMYNLQIKNVFTTEYFQFIGLIRNKQEINPSVAQMIVVVDPAQVSCLHNHSWKQIK